MRKEVEKPKVEKQLYRVCEAAEALAISERSIYRLCENGQMPFLKIMGGTRIRTADINRFVRAQLEAAAEENGFTLPDETPAK